MSVAGNLDRVRSALERAEAASGRPAGTVRLMAVSKFHPAASVAEAIRAGQRLFGESRVQEACAKFRAVRELCGEDSCELHIIGSLQRNKVKQALSEAAWVQSVDRLELAMELEKQALKARKTIGVLFELHTGEASKAGFASNEELARCIELCAAFQHLVPKGFMTMAPFTDDTKAIRKSFQTLRETAETMRRLFPHLPLPELSMGMSNDFTIAIEEGSTLVRIGSAIFGQHG